MIEQSTVKTSWIGLALGIGLVTALAQGCEAQPRDEGLSPRQHEELRALGIARVESSGDLHTLFDASGVELGTVAVDGMQADVVLGSRSATLERGALSASIACDGADARTVERAGALAAFIDDAGLAADCARALHVGRIVSAFDSGHAPGCEVETVGGQPRLVCDSQAESHEFRNAPGPDDCVCDDVGWGWCPPECWVCGAGSCGNDDWGGGGGGGGEAGGDWGAWCVMIDQPFERTHAVEELFWENPESLCPGAQADAEQACLDSALEECTAEPINATVIDADCADGSTKEVGCWCTVRVQCTYY